MSLSNEQRRAVERTGQDVCVIAGPGSGKTRVLIERFAWLVEQQSIDPLRILAITFTEKAATEIKERLLRRFAAREDLRPKIERAWVSTIHGFCARLLREHAVAAGIAPDFAVLDAPAASELQRRAADEALEQLYHERTDDMRRLLNTLAAGTQIDSDRVPDLASLLIDAYEAQRIGGRGAINLRHTSRLPHLKERLRYALTERHFKLTEKQRDAHVDFEIWANEFLALPDEASDDHLHCLNRYDVKNLKRDSRAMEVHKQIREWPGQVLSDLHSDLGALVIELLDRLHSIYQESKLSAGSLDFSDLEERTIELLESSPSLRATIQQDFEQILVDELQDTNRLQWRLFNLIRREHRLFAVGDINQSIYGFRHAEPDLFAAYRDNLSTQGFEIDDLRDNYRSREGILQSVELLLEGISGIEPRPLISKANYPKTEDYDLEIIYGPGENGPDIEAGLLAKRIRELENTLIIGTDNPRPAQLSDIAILGRSFSALDPITHALDRFGIPYIVNAGRTFLEAREVRDLMLLLSVIANPRDQIALAGVLRSPLVGASEEDIYRHLQNLPMPEGALTTFLHQLEQARAQRDSIAPDLLLARFLDASGYEANLPERARANIEKFLALLSNLSRRESRTTAELLAYLERLRIAQSEAEAAPSASGNMVQVLTFHAAKGLEWPIVFVVGLHRRPDNRMNSILYSPDHGLGLRWRNPIDGKTHGDPNWDAMRDREKDRSVREESRLLYVAMTRAQERLVLSYSEAKQPAAIIPSIQSAQSTIADRFITAEHPPVPEAVATQAGAAAASITIAAARKPESTRSTAAVTELAHTFEFTGWRPRAAAEFGTSAHAWLAGHFRGLNPDPNTSAGRLARGFLDSDLGRHAAAATRREVEFDFLYPLPNGTVLRGQIDLWFESAGRLVIVDYKTDQELNPQLYERQLRLYAVALQSYAGQMADEAWLYDLRKNTAIRIELSEQALFEAVNGVQNFGG